MCVDPLSPFKRAIRVNLLAHARQESASGTRRAHVLSLVTVIDLKSNFVQLRDGISADFARNTIVVRNAFGTILQATTHHRGLVGNFADDENRADNARGKTLENHRLVIIYCYL